MFLTLALVAILALLVTRPAHAEYLVPIQSDKMGTMSIDADSVYMLAGKVYVETVYSAAPEFHIAPNRSAYLVECPSGNAWMLPSGRSLNDMGPGTGTNGGWCGTLRIILTAKGAR
jgi:hypothetical protein